MDKLKFYFILLFCIITTQLATAQNNNIKDSLINILKQKTPDTTRINTLIKVSDRQYTNDFNQRVFWLSEALTLSKKKNLKELQAKVNQTIALVYIEDLDSLNGFKYLDDANKYYSVEGDDYHRAKQLVYYGYSYAVLNYHSIGAEYYKQALNISIDKDQILEINYLLGSSYIYIGDYEKAVIYLLQGASIADELNNNLMSTEINMNLGAIYMQLKKYDEALSCYTMAAEEKKNIDDKVALVAIYYNIGTIFHLQNRNDEATVVFKKDLEIAKQINDKRTLPLILGKLGNIVSKNGDFDLAAKYFKEAISYDNNNRNSEIYLYLGNLYSNKKDNQNAINSYLKGIEIAKNNNQLETLKYLTERISIIYKELKQFPKAYKYLSLHLATKDSLLNEQIVSRISDIQKEFEIEKQNNKILVLQKDNELQDLKLTRRKSLIIVLLMGLALLLALIIISIQRYRYVKRVSRIELNKTEQSYLIEKQILEQQIMGKNHELTNHIMHVTEKNEFIVQLTKKLQDLSKYLKKENQKILDDLIREIQANSKDNIWQEFDIRFDEIQKDFNDKLTMLFPDISTAERRLCAFLRMNMTSKEISAVTHQSPGGIDTARYRLRKKLNITDPNVNINTFLAEL